MRKQFYQTAQLFEITQNADCGLKYKRVVLFIIIFGTVSLPIPIHYGSFVTIHSGSRLTNGQTDTTDCITLPVNAVGDKTQQSRKAQTLHR